MSDVLSPFRQVHKRRAAEHVAEQIRDQILAGHFVAGRRLPPERELAHTFGVNRTTLREALRSLEQQRLLDIHHGDGATVLDVRVNAGLEVLAHLVRVDGQLDFQLLADILEARRIVGVELARLAALRSQEPDFARLEDVLDDLSDPAIGAERFQELDWAFFEALAQAARNRVFILVLNTVRPIYLENRDLFLPLYQNREPVLTLHRRLVERLRYRDPAGAVATMEEFLDLALPRFLPEEEFEVDDESARLPGADAAPSESGQPGQASVHPTGIAAGDVMTLRAPDSAHEGPAEDVRPRHRAAGSSSDASRPAARHSSQESEQPNRNVSQASGSRQSAYRPVAPSAEPWLERNN